MSIPLFHNRLEPDLNFLSTLLDRNRSLMGHDNLPHNPQSHQVYIPVRHLSLI